MDTDNPAVLVSQSTRSRVVTALVYAAGAVAAVASAFRANAGHSTLPLMWLAWIAGPYAALGWASDAIGRQPRSKPCRRALPAAAAASLAFTAYVYQSLWRGPHHSTEGLIFIFVPVWILLGTPLVFACTYGILHTVSTRTDASPPSAESS